MDSVRPRVATTRILNGQLRIEPAFVDLSQIVRDVASVVAPAAAAKGSSCRSRSIVMAVFFADPGRLQPIVKLCGTWRRTPSSSQDRQRVWVRVARSEADHQIHIVAADTGIGIKRAFLPYVFDRFRQRRRGLYREPPDRFGSQGGDEAKPDRIQRRDGRCLF